MSVSASRFSDAHIRKYVIIIIIMFDKMIGYISFYGRLGIFVFAVSLFDWFRKNCPLRIRCLIDFESSIVTLRWLHSL